MRELVILEGEKVVESAKISEEMLRKVRAVIKQQNQGWAETVAGGEEAPCMIPLEPLLVDERQAAQILGVSRRKVFDLNEAGELPCKRIGSRKLYSVARLREFAEGRVA
jgi:hypothetical protein